VARMRKAACRAWLTTPPQPHADEKAHAFRFAQMSEPSPRAGTR